MTLTLSKVLWRKKKISNDFYELLLKKLLSMYETKKKSFFKQSFVKKCPNNYVPLTNDSQRWTFLLPIWQTAESSSAFLLDWAPSDALICVVTVKSLCDIFAWMVLGTVNLLCSLFIWENLKELISLFVKLFLAAWKESHST